jgi:hypothetical protein
MIFIFKIKTKIRENRSPPPSPLIKRSPSQQIKKCDEDFLLELG